MPQRFYQRALSGDPHEIIVNARTFLKTNSLAASCDRVVIPALHLARLHAGQWQGCRMAKLGRTGRIVRLPLSALLRVRVVVSA